VSALFAAALGATMTLYAVRGLDQTSEQFRRGLASVAVELDADPTMLAAIISFETGGTFSPSIRNKHSGAVGLIQWIPSTARHILGMSTDEIGKLTREEQLPLVLKYLKTVSRGRKLATVSDFYAAVFGPKFIGSPDSTVMYRAPSKAYEWNKGLDRNRDGAITKGEAASIVNGIYKTALARGPLVDKGADHTIPFLLGLQLIRLALKI